MRISIDDRTGSKDWGYAFHCIDGSGIVVTESQGTLIQGNRVIEQNLLPTPEIKQEDSIDVHVPHSFGRWLGADEWRTAAIDRRVRA